MNAWRRRLIAVVGVAILASAAASAAADAAPATFAFTVSTPNPASHQYSVRLRCDGLPGDTAEFRMPVWTPGYYGVFDYAGNLRAFAATDSDGRPLAFSKSGPNAWVVQKGPAKTVLLSYDVVATSPFVANAFLDETRGYITPGALFVYVPGQLRRPVAVTVELNPRWSTVATGLEPVSNGPPHTFRAADFDVLYDSPILMGNLEALPTFEIKGVPHRFVGYALGEFDRRLFVDDLRAVLEAGTQIIGDIPYKHYTFLGIGPGRGGIEHANSTAVPFSGFGPDRAGRIRTLSFLAHEYFHHYNVKRIRPIALGPFDYDRPNVTDMLWVSEGFTSYYEFLMLVRSGRMTSQELLDALTRTIAAVENNPGRLFQSATASSRDTWTQGPFGRGASGVRRTISYYDKGLVLGLLLDFRIRHDTHNRKSLDTVMRTLYRRYYKKLGRGWTDAEFRRTCEETAGTALADFFEYASTTRKIDYEKYLGYAGLQLEPARVLPDADLGALVEDANGALTVAAVEDGSAAANAGIVAGDVLASVDGRAVDAAALKAMVAAKKPGDRAQVLIRRDGAERVVDVVFDARLERSWRLMTVPQPSAPQTAIFANWTAVTVK
jgi:predicted metalloprotease with PDZ domain